MVYDTSFQVPWPLLGSIGFWILTGAFRWWLFKGCERYTRGELGRAFPEVARPSLVHRVVIAIAPILASGLILLETFELLPIGTTAQYAVLCLCPIPILGLHLNLRHSVFSGSSMDGTYYVKEELPTKKRGTLTTIQLALLALLVYASGFTQVAT